MSKSYLLPSCVLLSCVTLGCGTTRMSDTPRTATEQVLVSQAVDNAVTLLDFRVLRGKKVYFDDRYVDSKVDKGYLLSSIRQQILAHGCLLQEKREEADYVIEARAGVLGTDRHAMLIGVPEMALPAIVPGQPSRIPEIPFAKKTDQHGVAKVAVFAYNRRTGRRLWQSGVVKSQSSAKDLWVLGAGPFQHGSVRSHTTLAGQELSVPFLRDDGQIVAVAEPTVATTQQSAWPEELVEDPKAISTLYAEMLMKLLPIGSASAAGLLMSQATPKPIKSKPTKDRRAEHSTSQGE